MSNLPATVRVAAPPEGFQGGVVSTRGNSSAVWDAQIVPQLQDYIRIPAKSPMFDHQWSEHGYMDEAMALLESWAKHTLVWITRWEEDRGRALHAEWRGLAHGIGEEVTQNGLSGSFLGVDENFGMLLRRGEQTHLLPLSTVLEQPA